MDRHEVPLIYGPETVWIAPVGTPVPEDPREVYDPDGPWNLLHPGVPDAPPDDLDE